MEEDLPRDMQALVLLRHIRLDRLVRLCNLPAEHVEKGLPHVPDPASAHVLGPGDERSRTHHLHQIHAFIHSDVTAFGLDVLLSDHIADECRADAVKIQEGHGVPVQRLSERDLVERLIAVLQEILHELGLRDAFRDLLGKVQIESFRTYDKVAQGGPSRSRHMRR